MTTTLEMATVDFERSYTLKEFLELDLPGDEDDDDTIQYELVRGKLMAKAKSGVSGEHSDIVALISSRLDSFAGRSADEKRLGTVFAVGSCTLGQTGPEASWVEPDVCFVMLGRMPDKFKGPIPVAPDIVVEVWSPSDSTEKIQNKIEAYQAAGVRLIWSIYMASKYILVHRADESRRIFLDLEDVLNGGAVLPGFTLKVSELF